MLLMLYKIFPYNHDDQFYTWVDKWSKYSRSIFCKNSNNSQERLEAFSVLSIISEHVKTKFILKNAVFIENWLTFMTNDLIPQLFKQQLKSVELGHIINIIEIIC